MRLVGGATWPRDGRGARSSMQRALPEPRDKRTRNAAGTATQFTFHGSPPPHQHAAPAPPSPPPPRGGLPSVSQGSVGANLRPIAILSPSTALFGGTTFNESPTSHKRSQPIPADRIHSRPYIRTISPHVRALLKIAAYSRPCHLRVIELQQAYESNHSRATHSVAPCCFLAAAAIF
jgi:hypothetical protein